MSTSFVQHWEGPQRMCACLPGMGMGAGDVRVHHCLLPGGGSHSCSAHQDDGPAAMGHQTLVGLPAAGQCCSTAVVGACGCSTALFAARRPYYLLHYTYGMDYTLEVRAVQGCLLKSFLSIGTR